MTIEILHEDEFVVAVNKPAGLLVHPDGSSEGPFLTDWILEHYPETKSVGEVLTLRTGEVIERPGIVHRLDRDTSGVMLVAKNQEAYDDLKGQFKERAVKKVYNAFVYGNFKESEGVVDRPIGKSKKNFKEWSAQRGARGALREAVTEYSVQDVGRDPETNEPFSFLLVRPRTGRTHQIRVHMKAVGHPIICDSLYAPNHKCILGFERQALHARTITFKNLEGKEVSVEASLPEDFKRALAVFS